MGDIAFQIDALDLLRHLVECVKIFQDIGLQVVLRINTKML